MEKENAVVHPQSQDVQEKKPSQVEKSNTGKVFAVLFYLAGAVLIFFSIKYFQSDVKMPLEISQYYFEPEKYVGGDAYNYIISASRSTAIMAKSLIFAIFGCTSLILGRMCH